MASKKKQQIDKSQSEPVLADGLKVHCAHDAIVDTVNLVPNPRNPNTHPDEQIRLLSKVIFSTGWRVPITVSNRSGFVVRGHGRLMAAAKLNAERVPVDYQDYESEAEEWADLVADNRIPELSETDFGVLKDIMVELDTGDFDMELTGFNHVEMENLMTYVPEGDPEKWNETEDENNNLAGMEEVDIVIRVPTKNEEEVKAWLANGEQKTGPGMGKGVLKRCGLL